MSDGGRWRLLLDDGAPGAWNMALDEALMESAADPGFEGHTLRLYWFEPACLSLGAFQPAVEGNFDACTRLGIDVVRRPTGGRAVLHDGCLTYSVSGPASGQVFRDGIRPSYQRIAAALVAALTALGVCEVAPVEASRSEAVSPSCFDHAAPFEPVALGAKLVGSAQLRRGRIALQHGSIRLVPGRVQAATLLNARQGQRGGMALADPPSVSELIGRCVKRPEAQAALVEAFAAAFGVKLLQDVPTGSERSRAAALETEKYRSPLWTERC